MRYYIFQYSPLETQNLLVTVEFHS